MEKYTFNDLSVNNNISYLCDSLDSNSASFIYFLFIHSTGIPNTDILVTSELTGSHDKKTKCFICITG